MQLTIILICVYDLCQLQKLKRPIAFEPMYICVCNAVTDSEIRDAVSDGVNSFSELSFRTGCGTKCGGCVPQARAIMDEKLDEMGGPSAVTSLRIVSS